MSVCVCASGVAGGGKLEPVLGVVVALLGAAYPPNVGAHVRANH